MEINTKKQVFNIIKDPEKHEFIRTHTFDNIPQYTPELFQFNDQKKNINQDSLNNIKLNDEENLNLEHSQEISEFKDTIKLKTIVNYSYQRDYFIFNLPTRIIYNKETKVYQFLLNDIIKLIHSYINNKSLFLNEDYSISYYTCDEKMDIDIEDKNLDDIKTYFFIGNYPLDDNTNYFINVPSDGCLYLKFRKRISKVKSLRYDIFEEENEEEIDDVPEQNNNNEGNYNTTSKRAKEKRIGYIIKKVFEWKGFRKYTDNRMSLIEAAQNVGLSKKTLDEYFNQIKEGKKYNFDFNKHKRDKVNILRGYVKKMNNANGNKTKGGKNNKNKQ